MNIKQKEKLEALNEKLVALQNKCNRAQSSLIQAEHAEGKILDRFLEEATLELE